MTRPLLAAADLQLLEWATDYYHHPVGEVFATALPRMLREGRDIGAPQPHWSITDGGRGALQGNALQRAPKQQQVLKRWSNGPCDEDALDAACEGWRPLARKLAEKGLGAHAAARCGHRCRAGIHRRARSGADADRRAGNRGAGTAWQPMRAATSCWMA